MLEKIGILPGPKIRPCQGPVQIRIAQAGIRGGTICKSLPKT